MIAPTVPRPASAPLLLVLVLLCACGHHEASLAGPAPPFRHHALSYVEFPVLDMQASRRFYAEAFGWEYNDYGPDYTGIREPGGEAGGMILVDEVTPGGLLVLLYSDDLDATLERVRAAGGVIVTEPFAFPGGRRFHFEDPNGYELAVFSAD